MKFITIDGDDVGQKITSSYLRNDLASLLKINEIVNEKTNLIARFLESQGFVVIFCAADGVAGYTEKNELDQSFLYEKICDIGGKEITFSVGLGNDLREAYIALLSAKSDGKNRLHNFQDI
ncbi:mCpol domain-containing protein [Massilia norwichensis]|jgi:minimal CRISPR polymerase domain|uniref:MCpol domain-containing protein n=1 Tax=Massilia norwichensis TaxID=1442366 RepID=A0ABT2A4C6_9BURK|nr:mCpol domain-containing protein [Massilia norwichensis]MCS0589033.1 mCpol domain-containing protein [Massilia norwichensis]